MNALVALISLVKDDSENVQNSKKIYKYSPNVLVF